MLDERYVLVQKAVTKWAGNEDNHQGVDDQQWDESLQEQFKHVQFRVHYSTVGILIP